MVVESLKPMKYKRGENPNSRKNLHPFPPGENGAKNNPHGYSITSRVKKLLEEQSKIIPPHAVPEDTNYRDQIARTIVTKAACGDVPMIKELLDRTEGKVPGDTPAGQVNNTQINIFCSERGKELTEKFADRLIEGKQ